MIIFKITYDCYFFTFIYFNRLTDNAELLRNRLKSLEDSREQLDDSLRQQIAYNRTLEREMHKLKPEVMQLIRQKDKHIMYVLNKQEEKKKRRILLNFFFFFLIILIFI